MLTKVSVHNFKNIEEATLELRRTNLITGPSGTGKTNLIEAISVLSELARGLNAEAGLTAAVRGGPKGADGGGTNPSRKQIEISAAGTIDDPDEKQHTPTTTDWELDISIDPVEGRLTAERLQTSARNSGNASVRAQIEPRTAMVYEQREGSERGMAAIAQLARGGRLGEGYEQTMPGDSTHYARIARAICNELSQVQVMNLNENALREPEVRRNEERLERDGRNIGSVVEEIVRTADGRALMDSWLISYTGCQCKGLRVGTTDQETTSKLEMQAQINGTEVPALLWGTGLLHFIAAVAAVFQKDPAGLLALPCTHIIRSGQLQHAPVFQCGSRWLRWTFVRNRAT